MTKCQKSSLSINKILASLFICLSLYNCGKEEILIPNAAFLLTNEIPDAGEEIFFENKSVNATSYFWDFGDGTRSTEENPNHIYKASGLYEISLKAFDNAGEISIFTTTLEIKERHLKEIWFQSSSIALPSNMLLFFGETDNENNFYLLSFPASLNASQLPFGGQTPFDSSSFGANDWFFSLIDNLSPIGDFGLEDQLIAGITISPSQIKGNGAADSRFFDIDEMVKSSGDTVSSYRLRVGYVLN